MKNKRHIWDLRTITSVLVYISFVLVLFIPLKFVDPNFVSKNYPHSQGYEIFLFRAGTYFEPFIELVFIAIAAILIGFIMFGVINVKVRAFIALLILGFTYVPFSFFLYLLPYLFNFWADSIQATIRSIVCERHHTDIVSTLPGYLYECHLSIYAIIFIPIRNFFVLMNLIVLSVLSGLIFLFISYIFQNKERYISFNRYTYFFLPVFAGSLPLIVIMAAGQIFDLYDYVLYQGCLLVTIVISFIPVIIRVCSETNTCDMIASDVKKIYVAISIFFFSVVTGAIILLASFVYGYDVLYLYLLHGDIEFHLLFASFYIFFAVILFLHTASFTDDGFSLVDMALIIIMSSISGGILVAILSDALASVQYVWHTQNNLISRHIYDSCVSLAQHKPCPYF